MISLWRWNLRRRANEIWVRIAAFGLAAFVTALAAALLPADILPELSATPAANSLMTILQIMASSLLTVTTFSVSIMLSAFASAASGATPRATTLLRDDRTTQGVLATFIGGFIYSLVSIIGLEMEIYGASGRLLLFIVTLAVLTAIIWQLVRWIDHLTDYGRMSDTIARVEDAATSALRQRMQHPFLGGKRLPPGAAPEGAPVHAPQTGYVQVIDMAALNDLAMREQMTVTLAAIPGDFVHPGAELARIPADKQTDSALWDEIRAAFGITDLRTFEQDPRFGVLILTEIAQRALSPAVNDSGTAIDILGRQVRVLSEWRNRPDTETAYPRVLVPGLALSDMMQDAFDAIGRDGAAMVEVMVRLMKSLLGLARQAPDLYAADAAHLAARALTRAEAAMVLDEDKNRLRSLADEIAALAGTARIRDGNRHA